MPSSQPKSASALNSDQLYRQLEELAAGLLYPSETDAPIEVFLWETGERGALSLDALLDYYGIAHNTVAEVPPEEFFEGVTDTYEWQDSQERADTERFCTMRDLFFANTTAQKHFWIGEHTVDVFLWGRTRDGNYVGFKTRIVET